MKGLYIVIGLLAFANIFSSCADDCEDLVCTTPPSPLVMELINDATGENILRSGMYDITDITITNTFNTQSLPISTNENYVVCEDIGWQTGLDNATYTIDIGAKSFNFTYHTEPVSRDCCALLGELEEFSSTDFDIESGSSGGYIVRLDL